jgi:hypothetical protein
MPVEKFRINIYQRGMLIFQPLFLLVMLSLNIWTSLHLRNLSKWETIVFPAAIVGLTVWAILHLFQWFRFKVELSDQGINISGTQLRWEDVESAHARIGTRFSSYNTFIELKSGDARTFKIPICIQRNLFLLREIQRYYPDMRKDREVVDSR